MSTKKTITVEKDHLNAMIQSLNHMLSQAAESEFHTLTGIAQSEGKKLLAALDKAYHEKVDPDA